MPATLDLIKQPGEVQWRRTRTTGVPGQGKQPLDCLLQPVRIVNSGGDDVTEVLPWPVQRRLKPEPQSGQRGTELVGGVGRECTFSRQHIVQTPSGAVQCGTHGVDLGNV